MTDPLRRTVLVRVMGADICRFLRLCAASGISPGDVRELDPITVKLRLPAGDVPAAERIARRLGCEMTVISFGGTERLRRRFAAPVARFPQRFPAGTQYGEVFQIDEYGGDMTEEIRAAMED